MVVHMTNDVKNYTSDDGMLFLMLLILNNTTRSISSFMCLKIISVTFHSCLGWLVGWSVGWIVFWFVCLQDSVKATGWISINLVGRTGRERTHEILGQVQITGWI